MCPPRFRTDVKAGVLPPAPGIHDAIGRLERIQYLFPCGQSGRLEFDPKRTGRDFRDIGGDRAALPGPQGKSAVDQTDFFHPQVRKQPPGSGRAQLALGVVDDDLGGRPDPERLDPFFPGGSIREALAEDESCWADFRSTQIAPGMWPLA